MNPYPTDPYSHPKAQSSAPGRLPQPPYASYDATGRPLRPDAYFGQPPLSLETTQPDPAFVYASMPLYPPQNSTEAHPQFVARYPASPFHSSLGDDPMSATASPADTTLSNSQSSAGSEEAHRLALTLPPETQVPVTFFNYSQPGSLTSTSAVTSSMGPARTHTTSATKDPVAKPAKATTRNTDKSHHCEECKASFNRYHDLKRHQILHQDTKPFQCPVCKKEFARREAIKRHFVAKPCGRKLSADEEKVALKGRAHPAPREYKEREGPASRRTSSPSSPPAEQTDSSTPEPSPASSLQPTFASDIPYTSTAPPPVFTSESWPQAPSVMQEDPAAITPISTPLLSPAYTDSSDTSSTMPLTRSSSHFEPHFSALASMPPGQPNASQEALKWWATQPESINSSRPAAPLMSPDTAYALAWPKMYLPSPDDYPSSPNDPPPSDYFNSKSSRSGAPPSKLRFWQQQWS